MVGYEKLVSNLLFTNTRGQDSIKYQKVKLINQGWQQNWGHDYNIL